MRVQQPKGHHRTHNKGRELWRKTSPIVPKAVQQQRIAKPTKPDGSSWWISLERTTFQAMVKARFPDAS